MNHTQRSLVYLLEFSIPVAIIESIFNRDRFVTEEAKKAYI